MLLLNKIFFQCGSAKSRIVKTELIFANLFLAPCEEAPQFNGIKSHANVLGFFSLQDSCSVPCTGWTCSGNESG